MTCFSILVVMALSLPRVDFLLWPCQLLPACLMAIATAVICLMPVISLSMYWFVSMCNNRFAG